MPQLLAAVQGKSPKSSLSIYPSRLDSHKAPDEVLLSLVAVLLTVHESCSLDTPDFMDVFDAFTGLNLGIVFLDQSGEPIESPQARKRLPDPIASLGSIIKESLFALRLCAQSNDLNIRSRALRALKASGL